MPHDETDEQQQPGEPGAAARRHRAADGPPPEPDETQTADAVHPYEAPHHGRHEAPSAPTAAAADPEASDPEAGDPESDGEHPAPDEAGDPSATAILETSDGETSDPDGEHPTPDEATDPGVTAVQPATVEPPGEGGATVVARGIGVRSRDGWIFHGVDLTAQPGELVAVVGPSGSGRSTLLLALGARLAAEGELQVLGVDTARRAAPRRVLRRVRAARVADAIALDPDLTVARNARDAADWAARPATDGLDLLQEWRDRSGLPLAGDHLLEHLAPLERLAVDIAVALVGTPDVLVLDDLDAGLTVTERARAWDLVRQAAQTGPTVIVSALDPPPEADHLITLGGGSSPETRPVDIQQEQDA